MGSYNLAGTFSDLSLEEGDKIVLIPTWSNWCQIENFKDPALRGVLSAQIPHEPCLALYEPFCPPIVGIYSGYGYLEDIEETPLTKEIERWSGIPIDTFVKYLTADGCYQVEDLEKNEGIKISDDVRAVISQLTMVVESHLVYNRMLSMADLHMHKPRLRFQLENTFKNFETVMSNYIDSLETMRVVRAEFDAILAITPEEVEQELDEKKKYDLMLRHQEYTSARSEYYMAEMKKDINHAKFKNLQIGELKVFLSIRNGGFNLLQKELIPLCKDLYLFIRMGSILNKLFHPSTHGGESCNFHDVHIEFRDFTAKVVRKQKNKYEYKFGE